MTQRAIYLRWSWRDLRARWVQVAAIAFIVALGSGTYSGLGSTTAWRRASYDASFERLRMHDLRVTLAAGSSVDAAAIVETARSIPHARMLDAAEAQLSGPVQVDASGRGKTVLVPGRIIGVETTHGGPLVDRLFATQGRTLRATDAGAAVGLLDVHFARHHDVRPGALLHLSGGHTVRVVGLGLSPEYFLVLGEQGTLLAEANFAVTFVSLETAQQLLGLPGRANALVVRLRPGANARLVRKELSEALAARFPEVGVTISPQGEERQYRMLYDDIAGDQRLYNIFALLILFGAAFAAFNLVGRIVEVQRREIGIGMALGTPTHRLAIRPLLMAFQVAFLGAVLGIVVGLAVSQLMLGVLRGFFPLPVWRQTFPLATFARGAALGLVVPFVATIIPVRRALRVTPVEAIRTGAVASRGGRLMVLLRRMPLPGRSTTQLPPRNVLREPRRTVMTALGIAAAIAVLLGVVGMLDSFYATIDRAHHELTRSAPHRLTVTLSAFGPDSSATVRAVAEQALVRDAHTELQLPGTIRHRATKIDVFVVVTDLDSPMWRPTIEDRARVRGPSIVISRKAADDLGVHPGETVLLRHPRRVGLTSYRFVESRVVVRGISPIPTRAVAWMDSRDGGALMNLSGIANVVVVDPKPSVSAARMERTLFPIVGVSSVQPVTAVTDTIRKELDRMLGILVIVEGAVLLLALLIAFNTASINADDRAREHATMFAFGLPLRTVALMAIGESLLVGVLGTAVGFAVGRLLLTWLVTRLLPSTLPDLGIVAALSSRTVALALVLGIGVVALAPLLTVRKLARMDVPSTLRVVE